MADNAIIDGTLVEKIRHCKNAKAIYAGCKIECTGCHSPMHIRGTWQRRTHFAHNPGHGRECLFNEGEYLNESDAHKSAKDAVEKFLRDAEYYNGYTIRQEFVMKDMGINRIADVAVFSNGFLTEVHEVQLSGITTSELKARTEDYQRFQVDVTWWFGLNANQHANKQWTRINCGHENELHFGMQENNYREYTINVQESAKE